VGRHPGDQEEVARIKPLRVAFRQRH
jgi:hypothetical protein